jgi:hypothetical protein
MATNYTATFTDMGNGLGGFLSAIQDPVITFVVVFALVGIVLAIGYAIAKKVGHSISKK